MSPGSRRDTPPQRDAAWRRRVAAARRQQRAGDLLVLADEAPTRALELEARRAAGDCLLQGRHFDLALEQFDAALEAVPDDPISLAQRAACLDRLARHDPHDREDDASAGPAPPFRPRQVLLFSGHRVDAPGRAQPRLPASKLPQATRALEQALDALGVGEGDLLLTQGAAGGDLLCAEACRRRGARVQLMLPVDAPDFIAQSVLTSADGEDWCQRFMALEATLHDPPRVMPEALGPPPPGVDAFERCNRWLLYTALAFGPQKLRFLCLWDGGGGDGPGGTAHMFREVQRRAGRVTWIDTRRL